MRRINLCLNARLIDICQRSLLLEELNSKLSKFIPEDLQAHCQVGSFNQGCLVLVVSDSVWASQLRYLLPELRDKLRSEEKIYQLSSIKINIAPQVTTHVTKPSNPPQLSSKARKIIHTGGDQCIYEPLKEALYHLAGESSGQ